MLLQWWFVTDLSQWVHVPAKPFFTDSGHIEWKASGQPVPLLVALAQNGVFLNVAQMRKLLGKFKVAIPPRLDKAALQKFVVETFICSEESRTKAFDYLGEASKEDGFLDSDLEDIVSCLDEEDANALDLKEMKAKKKERRGCKANQLRRCRFQIESKAPGKAEEEEEEEGEGEEGAQSKAEERAKDRAEEGLV